MELQSAGVVTHRKRAEDLGDFEKVSWVESCLGRRRLTFACSRMPLWRVPHVLGGRWKSQNRKNVYLSPYVKEPLNSKVIKSFVPELRSRKCFSCFEIPMLYICIFHIGMLCPFHTYPYLAMVPSSDFLILFEVLSRWNFFFFNSKIIYFQLD